MNFLFGDKPVGRVLWTERGPECLNFIGGGGDREPDAEDELDEANSLVLW